MRKVGETKDLQLAQRARTLLAQRGIEAEVRAEDDGTGATVWVFDEDNLAPAEVAVQDLFARPDAEEYRSIRSTPAAPPRPTPPRPRPFSGSGSSTLTWSIIAVCVGATMLTALPESKQLVRAFYISEYYGSSFPEIRQGQVWRLVTPVFLHGNILHLLFNMLWLYQLGGAIEAVEGKRYFGILLLLFAIICNTTQYLWAGPLFVGISGVVYGLLGYVWMMSRFQAGGVYQLAPNTLAFMLIWLVVCLVGIIPGVANANHVAGMVAGFLWGAIRSGFIKSWIRRRRYRKSLGD